MIDYTRALSAFNEYVSHYDVNDPKMKLKIIHTMHVAELSEQIAKGLHLNEEDIQLAKLIGLLHDIGRFEQLKRFNEFRDHLTVNHALLGVEVLKENDRIRDFIEEDTFDDIIFQAIENHNRLSIEEGLDERTLLHSKIIRDADKTDIFRVRIEDPVEDFLPFNKEDTENSLITRSLLDTFYSHQCILSSTRKTPADTMVSVLAFIYDYNFNVSLEIVKERNLLRRMMDRIHFVHPETQQQVNEMLDYADTYIEKRLENE